MSEKLGQSLDEILATQRSTAGRGGRNNNRRGGRVAGGRTSTAAPVGGITKNRKPVKGATKATSSGPSGGNLGSRIVVSNLPTDVTEQQMKDYFNEARLNAKSVQMAYAKNGASQGTATITFHRPGDANEAVAKLKGVRVDNKMLSVSLLLDAQSSAAIPLIATKKLGDRITAPKPQPKSASITKNTNNAQNSKRGGKRGSRGGAAAPRSVKKTAEELDLEMADYWDSGNAAGAATGEQATNEAAQPATNGDANMDDEIL